MVVLLISPVLWLRGVLVVVLVAFSMWSLLLMSVFSIAFLPAVMSPVLLLLLLVKLLAVVEVVVEVGGCLNYWTSHLDFYCVCLLTVVFSPLTLEALEALVVVDYFRCCCCCSALMKVLVAVLQERQELQAVQDRLDPDHYYYYLSALTSALISPLSSPVALA